MPETNLAWAGAPSSRSPRDLQLPGHLRLANAISAYKASLDKKHCVVFKNLQGATTSISTIDDVIQLTEEINRDGSKLYKCWSPHGTRMIKFLDGLRTFTHAGDVIIGGSQNIVASGVWAVIRVSLQLAIGYMTMLEKISSTWMRVAQTTQMHENLASLFPRSKPLKGHICNYLAVVVEFCTKVSTFLLANVLSRLATTLGASLERAFRDFEDDIRHWSVIISQEVTILNTSLQVETRTGVIGIRALLSSNRQDNSRKNLEERRIALYRRLSPEQDDYDLAWRRERRKGNVGWLSQESRFDSFKSCSPSMVMWVTGSLGSGKTVLMADLAARLLSSQDTRVRHLTAFFFCQFDDPRTLEPHVILQSILLQLLRKLNESELEEIIHTCNITAHDLAKVTDQIAAKLPKTRHYFIIVDGLHECQPPDAVEVAKKLAAIARRVPLHLAVSSRGESVMASSLLRVWEDEKLPVEDLSLDIPAQRSEIFTFVAAQVSSRNKNQRISPELETRMIDTISKHADGMFLWASLQIDNIFPPGQDCFLSEAEVLQTLDDLPDSLNLAFRRALSRIPRNKHGKAIFQIVAAAKRPLTGKELMLALNVTVGDTTWCTSTLQVNYFAAVPACGGSLLRLDEEDGKVRFIHASARQHLVNEQPAAPQQDSTRHSVPGQRTWYFSIDDAERLISGVCMTYLLLNIHNRQLTARRALNIDGAAVIQAVQRTAVTSTVGQLASRLLGGSTVNIADANANVGPSLYRITRPNQDSDFQNEFMSYAAQNWLEHAKSYRGNGPNQNERRVFRTLLVSPPEHLSLPWLDNMANVKELPPALEWSLRTGHAGIFCLYFCSMDDHQLEANLHFLLAHIYTEDIELRGKDLGNSVATILAWFSSVSRLKISIFSPVVIGLLRLGADPNSPVAITSNDALEHLCPVELIIRLIPARGNWTTETELLVRLVEHGADWTHILQSLTFDLASRIVFKSIELSSSDVLEALVQLDILFPFQFPRADNGDSVWDHPLSEPGTFAKGEPLTPLGFAITQLHSLHPCLQALRFLLSRADPTRPCSTLAGNKNKTPMELAIARGCVTTVQLIRRAIMARGHNDPDPLTLQMALKLGRSADSIILDLVNDAAPEFLISISGMADGGPTLLLVALKREYEFIEAQFPRIPLRILDRGVNVNTSYNGETPLGLALQLLSNAPDSLELESLVSAILACGALPNVPFRPHLSPSQIRPLRWAVEKSSHLVPVRRQRLIRMLVKAGAEVDGVFDCIMLKTLTERQDLLVLAGLGFDSLGHLLVEHYNCYCRENVLRVMDPRSRTKLQSMNWSNDPDNAGDAEAEVALSVAVFGPDYLRPLLQSFVNPDASTVPLYWVEMLLEAGVDPGSSDDPYEAHGRIIHDEDAGDYDDSGNYDNQALVPPILLAVALRKVEFVEVLLRYGASVAVCSEYDIYLGFYADRKKGYLPQTRIKKGETAIDIATRHEDIGILNMLRNRAVF